LRLFFLQNASRLRHAVRPKSHKVPWPGKGGLESLVGAATFVGPIDYAAPKTVEEARATILELGKRVARREISVDAHDSLVNGIKANLGDKAAEQQKKLDELEDANHFKACVIAIHHVPLTDDKRMRGHQPARRRGWATARKHVPASHLILLLLSS
jgi:hypothetical protein